MPDAGVSEAVLVRVTPSLSKEKKLPIFTVTFEVDGRTANFPLVFGAHPWVDRRNGKIIDSLHAIAGLDVPESPDWAFLVERLAGKRLLIHVTEDEVRRSIYLSDVRLNNRIGGDWDRTKGRGQAARGVAAERLEPETYEIIDD